MSETEWLAHKYPIALLSHLRADPDSRKVLLYASALCDLRSGYLTQSLRDWADEIEFILNEQQPPASLHKLRSDLETEFDSLAQQNSPTARAFYGELYTIFRGTWAHDAVKWGERVTEFDVGSDTRGEMRRAAVPLLRDIFGNPFRPVAFVPEWRTSTTTALAQQLYESRDFGAMPILADALQDTGCDSDEILDHCRNPQQVHVRGCWVVDLVLGRE